MKIGELSKAIQLPAMTIRYYETVGLLPQASRTSSNYRVYGREDAERLQFVKKAKHLGLSLGEIKGILHLYDRREATCSHVRTLLDQKLVHVDALLKELREFRTELIELSNAAGAVEDCRPSGGRICRFIEDAQVASGPRTLVILKRGARSGGEGAGRLREGMKTPIANQ